MHQDRRIKRGVKGVIAALGISVLACGSVVDSTVNRAVDQTFNTAANRVGEQVGNAIAGAVLADLEPSMMHIYTTSMFRVLFYHGGYYVEGMGSYEPGQYTRWQANDVEQGDTFERTLLRRRDDSTEWWRVESRDRADDGTEMVLIMEALLSEPDASGMRRVRRMRAKFPDEATPREIPITEQNSSQWVITSNQTLTPESMQGMTVDKAVPVTVPAGEYTAQHVRVDGYDASNHLDWYVVDSVPGGLVKYTNTVVGSDGQTTQTWAFALLEAGEGSTESKLGVDLDATLPEPAQDPKTSKTQGAEEQDS